LSIARAIHLTHPARTDLSPDFITTKFGAGDECHRFVKAIQFFTTSIGVNPLSSGKELIRNRCPSAVTT
jgi:hypothetical protein